MLNNRFLIGFSFLIAFIMVIVALFSLDIFAVATNDSVFYANYGVNNYYLNNPTEILEQKGTKVAGYPLFISLLLKLNLFGHDPLTFLVMMQRLILGVAVVLVIIQLKFYSIPLVFVLLSDKILAASNLVLTESITISFGVIYVVSFWAIYQSLYKDNEINWNLKSVLWWFILIFTTLFLVMIKVNLYAFVLPIILLLVKVRYTPKFRLTKSAYFIPALITLLLPTIFLVSLSIYNLNKYGQFSPMVNTARVFYWGVWNVVFIENGQNRGNPALADYYNPKGLYVFVHGTEKACGGGNYNCSNPIIHKRALEILDAASMSLSMQRLKSFSKALLGGGKQEISGIYRMIVPSNSFEYAYGNWLPNHLYREHGKDAFIKKANKGQELSVIPSISNFYLKNFPIQKAQAVLIIASFVLLLYIFIYNKKYSTVLLPFILFAASYIVICASLSIYLVDIWRFLITSWTIIATATLFAFKETVATYLHGKEIKWLH